MDITSYEPSELLINAVSVDGNYTDCLLEGTGLNVPLPTFPDCLLTPVAKQALITSPFLR